MPGRAARALTWGRHVHTTADGSAPASLRNAPPGMAAVRGTITCAKRPRCGKGDRTPGVQAGCRGRFGMTDNGLVPVTLGRLFLLPKSAPDSRAYACEPVPPFVGAGVRETRNTGSVGRPGDNEG